MIAGVADTHAALWYLLKNPRLSVSALNFIDGAANAGNDIVLSPISLAEILYLTEKNRLATSAYDDLKAALRDPSSVLQEGPFNVKVVDAMRRVDRDEIPDMPDRIVAEPLSFWECPLSAATDAYGPQPLRPSGSG